tara:strand:- start:144 stop:3410 length:3267 start_codon:yes stop_codon:yes gene_type:complete
MAQRNIDFGAFPDDPDADAIRSAFEKVQLNFTEVFAGLGDQAVVSVNKTAGPGVYLVNGSPVGNVVLGANISCVQFTSTTLSLTRDAPGNGSPGGSATITDSTQTLYIDIPNTVANISDVIVSNSIQGNAIIGNVSGDFGYILANATSGNGNINANNITLSAALIAANVSGNGAGLSAIAGANVTGTVPLATTAGTVSTIAQPNITSLGTLTTLDVQSTVTAVAFTANTGLFTGDGGGLSNITGANVTGQVTNAATANIVAGANVTGEVSHAAVSNSVAGANVSGAVTFASTANAVAGANVSGEVTNAAIANSVAGANVSGAVTFAGTANAVAGANVSGAVAFATTANAVAGANVSGEVTNAATANAVAAGNVIGTINLATFAGTANAVAGANVSGAVAFATTANAVAGANVSGAVAFATTANAIAGANVSGEVGFSAVSNSVAGANVSGTVANATYAVTTGTVETAAQPNITSTGTLTSLDVTGNVTAGNLTTTGLITGDGGGLSNISVSTGSYIENGTSEARLDASGPFRVTVGGTANILQVKNTGTKVEVLGSLSVSAGIDNNINFNSTSNLGPVSNVTVTGGTAGSFLKTDGAGTLSFDSATLVPAQGADTQVIFNDGGTDYAGNTGFTFNKTTGNLNTPGSIIAAGGVSAGILGGSLTTIAQPNITSVGTLSSLILSGNLNTNSDLITNAGNITIAGGSGTFIGNGNGLTNIPGANITGAVPTATLATFATTANAVAGANVSGEVTFAATANAVAGANVSGAVAFATTANAVAGANVSGVVTSATSATTASTVTTAAQPNITSVGTLSSLSVTGSVSAGNVSGTGGVFTYVSGDGANLTAITGQNVSGEVDFAQVANSVAGANVSGTVSSATTATTSGTVTTAAQPSITSLGTLSALGVNGIITASAVVANTGLFTGDGGGLSNVASANISGTVANATYATSAGSSALALDITGASQPNVTSVGTLTNLTVSGNITNQTHIIKDVTTVTATGTNLAGATAVAGADIFTVTTPSNDNGVLLMTAVAGLCLYIKNISASNILKVYPAPGDNIDGSPGAMSIGPKGHIQFVAHSSSAWYTVGATYA